MKSVLSITSNRCQHGVMGAPMLAACVLIAVCLASLAVDFGHAAMVRTELQNATDAAALAGAQDLYTNPDNAETHARLVAGVNKANGTLVSTTNPGCAVSVVVTLPAGANQGQVEVTASMRIRHWLASIFGRREDVISARSVAGPSALLRRVNAGRAFPLAVSLDAPGPNGWSLRSLHAGDTIELNINSQQQKNAAWTSFTLDPPNAHWLSDAIDYNLGLSSAEDDRFLIPPVKVGDSINLQNGVSGQKSLANNNNAAHDALLAAPMVILPVVSDLPPGNQESAVVGFVGVDVTDVKINEGHGQVMTIVGTLKPVSVEGDDCPSCPAGPDDAAFESISARSLNLIQ